MNTKALYKKLAKQYSTTPQEIEKEIQRSIELAFAAPSDEETLALQKSIPRKGEIPTPEEFIQFILEKIKEEPDI